MVNKNVITGRYSVRIINRLGTCLEFARTRRQDTALSIATRLNKGTGIDTEVLDKRTSRVWTSRFGCWTSLETGRVAQGLTATIAETPAGQRAMSRLGAELFQYGVNLSQANGGQF